MPLRRVLMVSGSLRHGSTNTAMLETARACAPDGVEAVLYEGLDALPHFNPDDDVEPLHPAVAELRAAIDAADALLFSTPEYAGALPGSFKNLLDWTIGGTPCFSLDNGSTCLGQFSRGAFNGDLRVAGHWRDDTLTGVTLGIMDPTRSGFMGGITDFNPTLLDRIAFDVMGYDVSLSSTVPEPPTWALMIVAFGFIGASECRRLRSS